MAGRPKKTKAEKEMAGTLRPCREVDNPLTFAPINSVSTPDYLDGYAVEFFEYYTKILAVVGILTPADIGEIEQAAISYDALRDAYDYIKEHGAVQTTESGYTQKNAHWQVLMDARKVLSEFYGKYGLNVISRERITMKPPEEPDDFDKIGK